MGGTSGARGPLSFKVRADAVVVDQGLSADDGWDALEVRWLITGATMGSELTVVGASTFPPGASHDLHRHPHAEEWEYVLDGFGIKRVGDEDLQIGPGDIVFTPRGVIHGVVNTSDEVLRTIWGYSGAGDLAQAGYVLASDDPEFVTPDGIWEKRS
jgi:quercetin dioxygenase-like cupin family protein